MSVLSVDEDESLISDADISESWGRSAHRDTQKHDHDKSCVERKKKKDTGTCEADGRHQQTVIAGDNTDVHSENITSVNVVTYQKLQNH